MSVATVANWGFNLVVAVTFLTLVQAVGRPETFWIYGVIGIAAWIFIFRLVPETKGKSLEEIEEHWRQGKHPRELGNNEGIKKWPDRLSTDSQLWYHWGLSYSGPDQPRWVHRLVLPGRFDGPAVFCRILDTNKGGYFQLVPEGDFSVKRSYLDATNILQSIFSSQTR